MTWQQDGRIRKEKNGLAIRITDTCKVGITPDCSVFPSCRYFLSSPKLPNSSIDICSWTVVIWSWVTGVPGKTS